MEQGQNIRITTEATELDYSQEAAHVQQMALSYLESWKLRLDAGESQAIHASYISLPDAAGRTRVIAIGVDTDGTATIQLGRYDTQPISIYTESYSIDSDGLLVRPQSDEVQTSDTTTNDYLLWSTLHAALFDCDALARRSQQ